MQTQTHAHTHTNTDTRTQHHTTRRSAEPHEAARHGSRSGDRKEPPLARSGSHACTRSADENSTTEPLLLNYTLLLKPQGAQGKGSSSSSTKLRRKAAQDNYSRHYIKQQTTATSGKVAVAVAAARRSIGSTNHGNGAPSKAPC